MTEMLPAIPDGKIKALYIIGENPVISDADADQVINPLQHLDFLVVQDIFLTETGKLAHVVLPAASFAEKDGTFTNTERRVARVRQADSSASALRSPSSQSHSEGFPGGSAIPCPLLDPQAVFRRDFARPRRPSYAGVAYDRLETEGGLQRPCPHPDHPGTVSSPPRPDLPRRGHFLAIDYREPAEMPDADYPPGVDYRPGALSGLAPGAHEPPSPGVGGESSRNAGWKSPPGTQPSMASARGRWCGSRAAGANWWPGLWCPPRPCRGPSSSPSTITSRGEQTHHRRPGPGGQNPGI